MISAAHAVRWQTRREGRASYCCQNSHTLRMQAARASATGVIATTSNVVTSLKVSDTAALCRVRRSCLKNEASLCDELRTCAAAKAELCRARLGPRHDTFAHVHCACSATKLSARFVNVLVYPRLAPRTQDDAARVLWCGRFRTALGLLIGQSLLVAA